MDVSPVLAAATAGAIIGVPAANSGLALAATDEIALSRLGLFDNVGTFSISAVAAVVAGFVGARLGWSIVLPVFVLATVFGLALSIVDLLGSRLPFAFSGTVYVAIVVGLGVDALASADATHLGRAVSGGAVVTIGFLVLAMALPGQLGLGDVVMVGWIAMTLARLGWRSLFVGLVASLVIQAVVTAVAVGTRRGNRRRHTPFGPALWFGWLAGVMA